MRLSYIKFAKTSGFFCAQKMVLYSVLHVHLNLKGNYSVLNSCWVSTQCYGGLKLNRQFSQWRYHNKCIVGQRMRILPDVQNIFTVHTHTYTKMLLV